MALKPKMFKTRTGFVEVYGDDGSVLTYAPERNSTKVGLYVVRKSPDYASNHIDAGASTELTPSQARKLADRLTAWADAIERNK